MLLSFPWGSPLTSLLIWRKLWRERDVICLWGVFVPIKWILYKANAVVGIIKFISAFFWHLNYSVGQHSLRAIYSDLAFFGKAQNIDFIGIQPHLCALPPYYLPWFMSLTLTRFLHRKLRGDWEPQWATETYKPSWIWACNCTCTLKPHRLADCAHPIFSVLSGLDDTAVPSQPSGSPHTFPPLLQMLNSCLRHLQGGKSGPQHPRRACL